MPIRQFNFRPGFMSIFTPTLNQGGWTTGGRIRWRFGQPEKIGGWVNVFSGTGTVRALHAYQDLLTNHNLLLGTSLNAQLYIQQVDTLYTFGYIARRSYVTITPTIGSATVSVNDPNHGQTTGTLFTFPITVSIGSRVILAQTQFALTRTDANNWTFVMPSLALDVTAIAPVFTFATTGLSHEVTVRLRGHGLIVGNSFVVQADTATRSAANVLLEVTAGTYIVASVISAIDFTITVPAYNSLDAGVNIVVEGVNSETGQSNANPQVNYFGIAPVNPSGWSLDNLGQNGVLSPASGPIFIYEPPVNPVTPVIFNAANGPDGAPQLNNTVFTAMPQAQLIAAGTEAVIEGGLLDPLLVRFSDAGSYAIWTASSTNQAGSFRLSRGSGIIGGLQGPTTTLLFTDLDCWSMSYTGPPLIYSFSILGSGCGLIAQKAVAILGRTVYWMSQKNFYMFDGGVRVLPCPVWDDVFPNINTSGGTADGINPVSKVYAVADSQFNEIFFFYPSDTSIECNKYAKFNPVENTWDIGPLTRSAAIDQSVFGSPLMAFSDGLGSYVVTQHEIGYDGGSDAMEDVFIESGYLEISDGDYISFIDQCIPDMKWFGENGAMNVTLYVVNYPTDTPVRYGPYSITPTTPYISMRARGRQVKIRYDWVQRLGFSARIGSVRFRYAPAGRRP